jgi:mannose-6-phosphate isomerase-like protein (cupin superfamily)
VPRRLVTGIDRDGRSCVVDELRFDLPVGEKAKSVFRQELFTTPSSPLPPRPPGRAGYIDLGVPPGIVRWSLGYSPPDRSDPVPMHHTDSVDFVTVLTGRVDLVLDDGPHPLEAGDCVVQMGVDHSWLGGPDGFTLLVAMIGAPPPSPAA